MPTMPISIIFRLIDLGVEPYLISPTLIAAVSQRMVRPYLSLLQGRLAYYAG